MNDDGPVLPRSHRHDVLAQIPNILLQSTPTQESNESFVRRDEDGSSPGYPNFVLVQRFGEASDGDAGDVFRRGEVVLPFLDVRPGFVRAIVDEGRVFTARRASKKSSEFTWEF